MQTELDGIYPGLDIQILGINEINQEVGNPVITEDRDLPWLQDIDSDGNDSSDVWYDLWDITFRDVWILDGENRPVGVYNVTVNNLAVVENYETLRAMISEAALSDQRPWTNAENPLDANVDTTIDVDDVWAIADYLFEHGASELISPAEGQSPSVYCDSNYDGYVSSTDVFVIAHHLFYNVWDALAVDGQMSAQLVEAAGLVDESRVTSHASSDHGEAASSDPHDLPREPLLVLLQPGRPAANGTRHGTTSIVAGDLSAAASSERTDSDLQIIGTFDRIS